MADESSKAGESAVEQHVRKILAQISALKRRLRAYEQAGQSASEDSSKVDRKDDSPSRIDSAQRPS